MDIDLHFVGSIASDIFIHLHVTAGNHAGNSAAACGADDVRKVYVAAHGSASDDQLPRLGESGGRLVTQVDKVGHGTNKVKEENRSYRFSRQKPKFRYVAKLTHNK